MENTSETERDLSLLEQIEQDPDTTQASMAARLGVAVGTVNWHIKRLIEKGYVKVKRAERRKLRYIITPEGLALRARLTMAYIENSMMLYRETRDQARNLLKQAKEKGYTKVRIAGDGDIADVCRLTSIEQGMSITEDAERKDVVVIEIEGRDLYLLEPATQ